METENNITGRRALLAGGGTIAFGGAVAYFASRSESGGQEYVPDTFHTSEETTGFGVELAGRPIAGDADAPVDIYYWTDYLCPFCKQFETETLPDVGLDYVDAGQARIITLSYPNIGEYSTPSAVWGRCVWEQVADTDPAAFWRWHGAAFDAQSESGHDWADEERFTSITEQTEAVSVADVDACRQDRGDAIRESIDTDIATAQSARIQGTPGFVLYNRESDVAGKIVGAQPYDNFADALDRVREA
ncbi:thioredoxin domain-containing protein [Halosimplex rubrum]|uniref:Thioredoxin domain-containing protein n=1 Tax=Halosimplex rubrum TaxID=869889 RepID=A0A7D5TBR3_9EURY|nr:thioredoxin domain-containing protein [Halosimplex rubrum]QLH76636.1 thioredoxin domain-containing protein [Halosimplex rubrum]